MNKWKISHPEQHLEGLKTTPATGHFQRTSMVETKKGDQPYRIPLDFMAFDPLSANKVLGPHTCIDVLRPLNQLNQPLRARLVKPDMLDPEKWGVKVRRTKEIESEMVAKSISPHLRNPAMIPIPRYIPTHVLVSTMVTHFGGAKGSRNHPPYELQSLWLCWRFIPNPWCTHLSHSQNPVFKWSTQNHVKN